MKKNSIEEFKQNLMFNTIHREERSDEFLEKLLDIRLHIKHDTTLDTHPLNMFFYIAGKITYYEQILVVLKELKLLCFKPPYISDLDKYISIFENRILEGKKSLKGLRKCVLEATKEWTEDRKQMDRDNPEHYKYLKGWF